MTWWQGRMCGFDTETTAPLPEEARIVTASIVYVGGGDPTTKAANWLADPGVDIPDEAAAIHGVTTEKAQTEGRPLAEVVDEVVRELMNALLFSIPLVIFNARYDLTVLDRECRRLGKLTLTERAAARGVPLLVVDPFVIDKWLDRFRKGSRKLDAVCKTYGATLDQAHASDADAIAAARAAWVLGAKGAVKRTIRGRAREADLRERAQLEAEWHRVRGDLRLLHEAQERWALAERDRFAQYKRSKGEEEEAQRIESERGWPVLDVMPHEEFAAAAAR